MKKKKISTPKQRRPLKLRAGQKLKATYHGKTIHPYTFNKTEYITEYQFTSYGIPYKLESNSKLTQMEFDKLQDGDKFEIESQERLRHPMWKITKLT